MEPISTLNSGASLAQQSKSYPLQNLAAKTRQLIGTQNRLDGYRSNEVQPINMGPVGLNTQKNKDKELMEVARKFEGILIYQMLKAMRNTVQKSELLNSFSLNQYESMMDEEIASEMAKQKGIGLADSLFYQLSRMEKASNPVAATSNKILGENQNE
jgi:Rod binding domain-containing protein